MTRIMNARPSPSMVVALIALFVALGGTGYAIDKISSKEIKRNAVKTKHVKDGTLMAEDFAPGQLPAGSQGPAGPAGQPGAPGQPGIPGQDATAPAGTVAFFNLASCPSGWAELTAAQGRYIVGLPAGGTLAGTAGTALTDLENRPVGQHNHSITDPQHRHSYSLPLGISDSPEAAYDSATPASINDNRQTGFASTGITVNNEGTVAGTNAPYIQLLVCQKS